MTATSLPVAARPVRRRSRGRTRSSRRFALLLMTPSIIGFLVFFVYPMIATVILSFTHYDLIAPPRWIGLANYRYMFHGDDNVELALRNTLWIIVVGVPANILFALFTATMLTKARRSSGAFRTIYYLPALTPPVAATLAFVYMFNPATGPVNQVLSFLHLPTPLWFDDPSWSKPALVLLGMWGIGQLMVIFLAGLLDVPGELYEAASLDGAGAWARFRYVTVPAISPVLLFAAVTGVVDGLQYFTEAYVAANIASGGDTVSQGASGLGYPNGSTLFYPIWLYQQGFHYFNMGYASAMAVVLFVLSLAFIVLFVRRTARVIHVRAGT
jgi:multiple sugar transport system permease protein